MMLSQFARTDVCYRDHVVHQIIIHGMRDNAIRVRVLSRNTSGELTTMDKLIDYIAAEEEYLEEVTKAHKISIGARSPFLRFTRVSGSLLKSSQDQNRGKKSVSQVLEVPREYLEEVKKAHKIRIGARSPFLRFSRFPESILKR